MIESTDVLTYAVALGVAVSIPGPGITALVARTISGGKLAGYAMLLGLILGDIVFLSFAVFGLGLIAQTFTFVFDLIRWLSVCYLLFLAWQFWRTEFQDLKITPASGKTLFMACVSGFVITLSNPKAIAFYLALLPLVIDLESISVQSWALILVPTAILVLLIVGSVYILGVMAVRQALSSVKAQQRLHKIASAAMAIAALSMILKAI